MLHKYQAWVRPVGGSTFNGHTITNWYSPGYYEDRVDVNSSNAILVDMRGVSPYADDGTSNLASFLVAPGHLAVIGDFEMDFSRSAEHTSDLQSLMGISYAAFCLQKQHTQVRSDECKLMINN